MFLVSTRLCSTPIPTPVHLEIVCVEIKGERESLRLINWYRSPNSSLDYLLESCRCIEGLFETQSECILFSDANFPGISWEKGVSKTAKGRVFLDLCSSLGLDQLVDSPTRGRNILDLVLCQNPCCVASLKVGDPFLLSDHNSVEVLVNVPGSLFSSPIVPPTPFRVFRKGDYASMAQYLDSFDWGYIGGLCPDPTEFYSLLLSIWEECIALFVPLCKPHHRPTVLPRSLYRLKLHCLSLSRHRKESPQARARLRRCERRYHRRLHNFFSGIDRAALSGGGLSSLYAHMRRVQGKGKNVISSLIHEGKGYSLPLDKSELFANHFASVFGTSTDSGPPLACLAPCSLSEIDVGPHRVLHALRSMKGKLGTSCDGIPSYFLRCLSSSLSLPLSLLFQLSMAMSQIPDQWRSSIVVPIYKKRGSQADVKNYRPIAMISATCKVMEKVVTLQLSSYLESNQLLSAHQYGFRSRRSTTSQLLQSLSVWSRMLSEGRPGDTVYLDFARAFDKVPHAKLLAKCASYGISGRLLEWLRDFLSCRTQLVRVDDTLSSPRPIQSSILQGGCLSPLLFALYINDLAVELSSLGIHVWLYADDVKLTSDSPAKLQQALDCVSRWCDCWELSLSVSKCTVLPIGVGLGAQYSVGGQNIPIAEDLTQRDLGFIITPSLSFAEHCETLITRTRQTCGVILRAFSTPDPHLLIQAFTIYARPILEYGTPVYNSIGQSDSRSLESVQKWFTKRVFQRCHMRDRGYEHRLAKLGIESLHKRRFLNDLALVQKVYNGAHVCPGLLNRKENARPLVHNHRLISDIGARGTERLQWPQRCVSTWNSMPDNVILGRADRFRVYLSQ